MRETGEKNCQMLSKNCKKANVPIFRVPGFPLIHQNLYFVHRDECEILKTWMFSAFCFGFFLWLWVTQTLEVVPLVMDIPWLFALLFHLRLMKIPHTIMPMITTTSTTGMRMMMGLKPSSSETSARVEIRLIKMGLVSRSKDITL